MSRRSRRRGNGDLQAQRARLVAEVAALEADAAKLRVMVPPLRRAVDGLRRSLVVAEGRLGAARNAFFLYAAERAHEPGPKALPGMLALDDAYTALWSGIEAFEQALLGGDAPTANGFETLAAELSDAPQDAAPTTTATQPVSLLKLPYWWVWLDEYPDEGSALVEAQSSAEARALSGLGEDTADDGDGLSVRRVTVADLPSLVERACEEQRAEMRDSVSRDPEWTATALCQHLAVQPKSRPFAADTMRPDVSLPGEDPTQAQVRARWMAAHHHGAGYHEWDADHPVPLAAVRAYIDDENGGSLGYSDVHALLGEIEHLRARGAEMHWRAPAAEAADFEQLQATIARLGDLVGVQAAERDRAIEQRDERDAALRAIVAELRAEVLAIEDDDALAVLDEVLGDGWADIPDEEPEAFGPDDVIAPAAVSVIGIEGATQMRVKPMTRASHARMYASLERQPGLQAGYRAMVPGVEMWAERLGLPRCRPHGSIVLPCYRCGGDAETETADIYHDCPHCGADAAGPDPCRDCEDPEGDDW